MGGSGSGNHWQIGRVTVESCKRIDVNRWNRDGLLKPGMRFSPRWTYGGEPSGEINVRTESGVVILSFRHRQNGGEWESVEQRVPLQWTPCHFGGQRPWFTCSVYRNGVYCGRRVAKLYAAGKYFACRRCYNLAYASQSEDRSSRSMRNAQKIRERLGGGASMMEPFPDKPKGMHWKTYERLQDDAERYEAMGWMEAARRFGIAL